MLPLLPEVDAVGVVVEGASPSGVGCLSGFISAKLCGLVTVAEVLGRFKSLLEVFALRLSRSWYMLAAMRARFWSAVGCAVLPMEIRWRALALLSCS